MNISDNVRAIRESLKIKQIEIAERLGLEQSNYARLEKRGNKITFEQLQQIADVFRMSVTEIINYPNNGTNTANDEELRESVALLSDKMDFWSFLLNHSTGKDFLADFDKRYHLGNGAYLHYKQMNRKEFESMKREFEAYKEENQSTSTFGQSL